MTTKTHHASTEHTGTKHASTEHTGTKHASTKPTANPETKRYLIVAALVLVAFFGAYRYAAASSAAVAGGADPAQASGLGGLVSAATGAGAAGGGCCGGGGAPVEGAATLEGDVQKITVDLSSGSYNPNVIKLKAGTPTEITFGQSAGCTQWVQSSDLGFQEDLSSGPKTVKLQGLAAGTYNFACGMNMVTGTVVVE